MKELLPQLIDALAPLLIAVTTFVFARLGVLISSRVKSEQLRTIGLHLNSAASDVVLELEQNAVARLRSASKDGRIDQAEIADLKSVALDNLKRYLGERGKADALKAFGFKSEEELEDLLRAKLEAEVAKMKAAVQSRAAQVVNVSTIRSTSDG